MTVELKASIIDTKIIAKVSDKNKIGTVSGKFLQNLESELRFDA